MQDLLAELGLRIQFQPIAEPGVEAAFSELAETAMRPGSELILIRGKMKTGTEMKALVVFDASDRQALDADPHVENGEAISARPLLPCPAGQNFG